MADKVIQEPKLIDIDKVLRSRKSKVLNMLPRFVVNYIKKIIHQDDINYYITKYNHLSGIDFVNASTEEFGTKITVIGGENLQKTNGRYIFASNHPLGGVDGALLIRELTKLTGETKSISNDLIMNMTNMQPCFIGVNSYGSKSKESVENFEAEFNSNINVLIFPAGLVSRRINGEIKDLEWKNTFIKRAIKHQRDVVPIHISGRLSNFFYNFANLRKKLGIKFNLELFFLVDELFKQRKDHLIVTIGNPIPYTLFKERGNISECTMKMREFIYKLPKDRNVNFIEYIND